MSDLPPYYFRVRENGAAVFRVEDDPRQRRLDLNQIAVINIRNGEVKPQGGRDLAPEDEAAIADWMTDRKDLLAARELDDIHRAIDQLNMMSQWVQSRASDADLEDITDRMLLAMHDLRTLLVRKKADRIGKARDNDG